MVGKYENSYMLMLIVSGLHPYKWGREGYTVTPALPYEVQSVNIRFSAKMILVKETRSNDRFPTF